MYPDRLCHHQLGVACLPYQAQGQAFSRLFLWLWGREILRECSRAIVVCRRWPWMLTINNVAHQWAQEGSNYNWLRQAGSTIRAKAGSITPYCCYYANDAFSLSDGRTNGCRKHKQDHHVTTRCHCWSWFDEQIATTSPHARLDCHAAIKRSKLDAWRHCSCHRRCHHSQAVSLIC